MITDNLRVALYARVSGEQQEKEDTIASQLEVVTERIAADGLDCEPELHFVDDGVSGYILARPALERLRDQAAAGAIDRLYMLDPDRLSRKYAYQVLILEELIRCGVEVVFLRNPVGRSPEADLLLQVQGMIAEYERAKIMERCRRGKQHAARRGSVNVLSGAPYGYRYIGKHEGGGEARYQVLAEEARVVRKIFEWVGQQRCSIGEVCRRLRRDSIPTRTGKSAWDRATVWLILKNPAYKGTAAFGKTRSGEFKPQRLRPQRGRPEHPRRPVSRVDTASEDQILIEVPGLVSEDLFLAVQAQLEENRQRRRDRPGGGRYLLQGLVVCKRCGYGCYGKPTSRAASEGKGRVPYAYYRCTGSDAYRFGGQRLCWNKQIRTAILDAAVWEDVRGLLSEPERVREEYERRLQGTQGGPNQEVEHLGKLINNVKKMISRLIDAYGDGLLDKSEFEPRISAARTRLSRLAEEHRQRIGEAAQEAELRLVIGQLEEFARRVSQGLQEPDWATRREVVRALVKKVEVDETEIRIVYRVSPSPFERGPQQGRLQHCWGRDDTGPLTRLRMETIDDDVASRAVEFIERQAKADKPFFVWVNFTHMHFRTHVKPESKGQSGRWMSEYCDAMIDHDKNVGTVLKALDDAGIANNTFVMYSTDNGPHMNSWPDGAMTPFRNEKNSNWEGAYRVPCMVRWPGKIKAGSVSNEIVGHHDWLPTILAMAGDTEVADKLLKGYKVGEMTYKVHLDGYNLVPYLTGQVEKSPRESFLYCNDDQQLTGLRYDNWKLVFMEQRAQGTLRIWAEPFTTLRVPKIFNIRLDPYERADVTSNTYYDWLLDHAFLLVPAQDYVGKFLMTFKEFPQRQKASSFNLDDVLQKLKEAPSK